MKNYIIVLIAVFANALSNNLLACDANFTHTNACTGDTIVFHAHDQYAIYTWDFNDNSPDAVNQAHDTTAYHVYTQPGNYYVTLFVNVGAEWDYQTQVVTVGNNCFGAAFSSQCNGFLIENFHNESYGHINSWQWNFGDTASASNDTSSQENPQHYFSTTGTFSISLIISDGTGTDSLVQTVTIDSSCIVTIIYPALSSNCKEDTMKFGIFYSPYAASLTSLVWDFGDPASGTNNFSGDSVPVHLFSDTGTFITRLITSDGIHSDTNVTYIRIIDCNVWPGDADRDGEVNMDDLLPVGMSYNEAGPARLNASLNWIPQPAERWNLNFNFLYLQDLVDRKFVDSNGDGLIDSLDVNAISLNYGLHHNNHNNNTGMSNVHLYDPELKLQLQNDTLLSGNYISIPVILGNISAPASQFAGASMYINYDASQVENGFTSVDFTGNLTGLPDSNLLTLSHIDDAAGKIDIGMIIRNHTALSNVYGIVATVTLKLKNTSTGIFHISFSGNSKVMTNYFASNVQVFYPVNLINDSAVINNPTGIRDISEQLNINIFPNPNSGNFIVRLREELSDDAEISVYDITGKIMVSEPGMKRISDNSAIISCKDLSPGVYILRIINSGTSGFSRIIIY